MTPQFYVERAHEAQAMTEALESRRQEVTALYHRWEELRHQRSLRTRQGWLRQFHWR